MSFASVDPAVQLVTNQNFRSTSTRKTFGIWLAIRASPKAIDLIILDAVNGRRRPSRTPSNKITTLK
jgi:hypothetical protein